MGSYTFLQVLLGEYEGMFVVHTLFASKGLIKETMQTNAKRKIQIYAAAGGVMNVRFSMIKLQQDS
jgi:hypothetical protein